MHDKQSSSTANAIKFVGILGVLVIMALTNPSPEKFYAVCGGTKDDYNVGSLVIVSLAYPNGGDHTAFGLFGQIIYNGSRRERKAREEENPRPPDEGFIHWIQGQSVIAEKHTLGDDHWRIQPKEVSAFEVRKITRNPNDKTFAATAFFHATSSGKGIECEAIIIYESVDAEKLRFISFTSTSVKKVGNW